MTTVSRQLRALAQVGRALFCLTGAYQLLGSVPVAVSQEKPRLRPSRLQRQQAPAKTVADTGEGLRYRKKATSDSAQLRTPDQLDALVAPIALYPDELLAQTLVASTYPLEIVQLQQWLAKNPGLKDKALADSVAKQPWDPSIQSMAPLPGSGQTSGRRHPVDHRAGQRVSGATGRRDDCRPADAKEGEGQGHAGDQRAAEGGDPGGREEGSDRHPVGRTQRWCTFRPTARPSSTVLRSIPIRPSTIRTIRPAPRSFRSAWA